MQFSKNVQPNKISLEHSTSVSEMHREKLLREVLQKKAKKGFYTMLFFGAAFHTGRIAIGKKAFCCFALWNDTSFLLFFLLDEILKFCN